MSFIVQIIAFSIENVVNILFNSKYYDPRGLVVQFLAYIVMIV